MALNLGRDSSHPQDLGQEPAGWDDAQGGGKGDKRVLQREQGCSAGPERFLCWCYDWYRCGKYQQAAMIFTDFKQDQAAIISFN